MRKKIVAGNWKMNLNKEQTLYLMQEIAIELADLDLKEHRVIVAPPFVNLQAVTESNQDSRIEVAAQNMHYAESGAFTGEVSASMLKDIQISIVILGHSERREYFYENDALLKMKVQTALNNEMEIIFCFGEKIDDRTNGNHFKIVENQIRNVLFDFDIKYWDQIILAYEPVWAIGTGETATPEQAQEMHLFIRELIEDQYNKKVAENCSILYGGSVKPSNATEIFSKPDVDGGLIGGASLKAEDFSAIIKAI